ncbi:MAG: sugar transferase, partial [Thermoleophilaceae bacterium]
MPRPLDVVLAGAGLVVASPLLALAAILIKLESRGPVFYRQRRVGLRGRPFELWKLRTMVPRAETMGDGIYVLEGDPRITRVGRVLRRFSL